MKLYFIAFVLAHSRMKYVEWRECPFTTKDTIRCHESAFHFYGGRPSEIVYDQNHLIAINENAGDVLLTNEFQAYVNERKFRTHLCHRADPESKDMIENVVKYIKRNFADSRVYQHIEDWNDRSMRWLERTGNYNVNRQQKKDQLKQLKQLNWLEQLYNLILLGPPGVGKTFLAVELGIEAVNHGFKVYFVTMGELVQLLKSEEFSSKSKIQ